MILIKEGDGGSYVQMLQVALRRAGFDTGSTDGIFGARTKAAVVAFQNQQGLVPDGIVGAITAERLRPFWVGYTIHTVRAGDTIYDIAKWYGSTQQLIENANPDIDDTNLRVGYRLIVPLNFSLVPTNIEYNSLFVQLISEGLSVRYPFIELSVVGRSVMNQPIPMLIMGRGEKKVFFNSSHHANEWITTPLLLKFIEDYAKGVITATNIGGINSEELFNNTTLYAVPLVNPDGVDLVTGALSKESEQYMDALNFANNYPEIPFPSGWKANINGVDLNLNYPAMWERARQQKFALGFNRPGPRDFVGEEPLDQPESRAIYNLSIREDFDLTVSFHTQGEEIYWRFGDYIPPKGGIIGEQMARASGYRLADPTEFSSYAGYKDWFIMTYLRPGYTVEAGRGRNPLPITQFDTIYPQVTGIMVTALNEV